MMGLNIIYGLRINGKYLVKYNLQKTKLNMNFYNAPVRIVPNAKVRMKLITKQESILIINIITSPLAYSSK